MQISNKKIKTKQTKVKQVQSNSSPDSAWSSWPTPSSLPSSPFSSPPTLALPHFDFFESRKRHNKGMPTIL